MVLNISMKKSFLLIMYLGFSLSATACELHDATQRSPLMTDTTFIPLGGNTFVDAKFEVGEPITQNGIQTWTSDKSVFNIYLKIKYSKLKTTSLLTLKFYVKDIL